MDAPYITDDSMADSGTAINLLRQKFPGMFADAQPPPNRMFDSGRAVAPQQTQVDPNTIPQPDLGNKADKLVAMMQGGLPAATTPQNKFNLPWLPGYRAPGTMGPNGPTRPPMTTPTGQMVPGLTTGQKLQVLLKSGVQGALAGRASSEQAVIQSGGRRSGGAGLGFMAGMELPAQQTATQQSLQHGGLENQQLRQQVAMQPQTQALGVMGKLAEIQKNISDAQKNRFVTPRSGGVYDIQSGQFAPGTEPADKSITIDNLLAAAAEKAQSAGRDPTKDPQVQQLSDVKTSLQKETQPKTQNDFEQFYGKYLRDNKLPDTAENMQRAHQTFEVKPIQPGAGDARLDRSYQFNSTQLEKLSQPIDAAVLRMGRLQDTLNQNSPQADALVAPELLTVMAGGQGSGLRMNEAEIARIVGGRSNWQSLQAAVNKWSLDPKTANSITPAQRQQIRALVSTVQQKLAAKQGALDAAHEDLINATDVAGHRRVVAGARSKMTAVDQGGGQVTVTDPNGGVHTFADQASADRFKKLARIK
jgi:hypothetical protein